MIKATDARGVTLLTEYDELGRTLGTWSGTKTDADQLTSFTYDTLLKGYVDSSTRYIGGKMGQAYTKAVAAYDTLNRPTSTQLKLPATDPLVQAGSPATVELGAHYRIDGSPGSSTEPALGGLPKEIVSYGYNSVGLVKSITGTTGYLLDVDYSATGQVQQMVLGTGNTEAFKKTYVSNTYEEGTNRLLRSHVTDQTHPYMLQDLTYSYDQAGNVKSIADPTTLGGTATAETQCFRFDGHRRMTEAWTPASQNCADPRNASSLSGPAPYWTSYTYNAAGQRATETQHRPSGDATTTYCYKGTQPHTLTGTSTSGNCATPERPYTYDATGNMKTRPGPQTAVPGLDPGGASSPASQKGRKPPTTFMTLMATCSSAPRRAASASSTQVRRNSTAGPTARRGPSARTRPAKRGSRSARTKRAVRNSTTWQATTTARRPWPSARTRPSPS